MTFRLALLLIFTCFPQVLSAQDAVGDAPPAGERGQEAVLPLDEAASAALALSHAPGQIIGAESYEDNDDFFREFTIQQVSGMIMEVDVNTNSGRIDDVRITYVPEGVSLPAPEVTVTEARVNALKYISKKTTGMTPKLVDSDYTLESGLPVYKVRIRKGSNNYTVVVNARTGDIVSSRRK